MLADAELAVAREPASGGGSPMRCGSRARPTTCWATSTRRRRRSRRLDTWWRWRSTAPTSLRCAAGKHPPAARTGPGRSCSCARRPRGWSSSATATSSWASACTPWRHDRRPPGRGARCPRGAGQGAARPAARRPCIAHLLRREPGGPGSRLPGGVRSRRRADRRPGGRGDRAPDALARHADRRPDRGPPLPQRRGDGARRVVGPHLRGAAHPAVPADVSLRSPRSRTG